jgi:hypothetical protein
MNKNIMDLMNIEQQSKQEKSITTLELHYILKLGDDFYHQSISCGSIIDMQDKAKALEMKFGLMELGIRVKKKNLVITHIQTSNDNRYTLPRFNVSNKDEDKVLDSGILFNPPLNKQLNKFRAEIEKANTIDELLDDNVVPKFDSNLCKYVDDILFEEPKEQRNIKTLIEEPKEQRNIKTLIEEENKADEEFDYSNLVLGGFSDNGTSALCVPHIASLSFDTQNIIKEGIKKLEAKGATVDWSSWPTSAESIEAQKLVTLDIVLNDTNHGIPTISADIEI